MRNNEKAFRLLAAHAADHHGVFSRREALDLDILPGTLTYWARTGVIELVDNQVYRLAGAPDTWRQRLTIATLTTNGFASHRAAGALVTLDGCTARLEVITNRWQRRKRPGLTLHEATDLKPCDVTEIDGIASTNLVRTLLDLPAVVRPFQAALALDDAWRRDPTIIHQVHRRFLEVARRGRRGTTLMRGMLEERLEIAIAPGSGFETRCEKLVMNAGLPRPVRQVEVRDTDFEAHIDLGWPDILFGIECDSLAHHSGKRAHEWDRIRRRRLKLLGWEIVEVTYDDITKRPDTTADQLRALYFRQVASVRSNPLT